MPAPVVGFLLSPAGQALVGGILAEAPALAGRLLAIWHKQGLVQSDEIAKFISGWADAGSFYAAPQPMVGATGGGTK